MNVLRSVPSTPPAGDEARLEELSEFRVFGTWPETQFDEITQMIGSIFNTPMAIISLVGRDTQWLKSCVGLRSKEIPRDIAFCHHTIMSDDVLVVPDARQDRRFRDNPLVLNDPHIRFYAGAPLITKNGFRLGALCALDTKSRGGCDGRQELLLKNFASLVVTQLEMRCERLPS